MEERKEQDWETSEILKYKNISFLYRRIMLILVIGDGLQFLKALIHITHPKY